jgi:hypothetical protein
MSMSCASGKFRSRKITQQEGLLAQQRTCRNQQGSFLGMLGPRVDGVGANGSREGSLCGVWAQMGLAVRFPTGND